MIARRRAAAVSELTNRPRFDVRYRTRRHNLRWFMPKPGPQTPSQRLAVVYYGGNYTCQCRVGRTGRATPRKRQPEDAMLANRTNQRGHIDSALSLLSPYHRLNPTSSIFESPPV